MCNTCVIAENILERFRAHHAGLNPTVKQEEKAKSKVSRVKSFLLYMGHGHTRLSDWLFLYDLPRIRA